MSSNKPFSALILAGGKSSRMGRDKALLSINGQSLLAHMQQLAIDSGAAEVLVSRNQPGFINDTEHQAGPLAGILAALAHCTTSQLLILPVDTPLLSAASLQQLVLEANDDAAYFANSPLPCVLPLSPALSELIRKQLHSGQRSVQALLTELNATALPAPEAELLNTNTPADWQHYLSSINSGSLYAKA